MTRAVSACLALMSVVLIAAGAGAGAAGAAMSWNATPLPVEPGKSLSAVSCPSASRCVATAGAQELTFDPNRFRSPRPHTLFSGRGLQIEGLWCSTATLCVGIDFRSAVNFNPSRFGSRPRPTTLESVSGEGLVSVRCPARRECVAVDSYGGGMTYDPLTQRVVRRRFGIEPDERLTALACPAVSQCTALDDNGTQITFQPQSGRVLSRFKIDPAVGLDAPSGGSDNELDAISCPATKLCAAVDTLGNIITFDPLVTAGTASFATTTVQADLGNSLSAISCKPSGVCAAVDRSGNAVGGSAVTDSWQLQAVAPGHAFNALACPTTTECVAVDNGGSAFRLYPTAT